MPALATTFERDLDADVTLLRVTGRLDLKTAPIVRRALAKCVAECPAAVVVDLSGCTVSATSALTAFPAAARAQDFQPAVAVLVCGADDTFVHDGGELALGSVSRYRTRTEAIRAAGATRAGQRRVSLQGPASVRLPGRARAAVGEACEEWGLDHLYESATLIISELATNAVRYSNDDVTVEAMVRGEFLHLRVRDRSKDPPIPVTVEAVRDGGRGLAIVGSYSNAWGCVISPDGSGKVVWATLRSRSQPRLDRGS